MRRSRLLLAALLAVGSMAVAPAASAEENCVGAEGLAVVCFEPLGRSVYVTCVYTGGETCEEVWITAPDFTRCEVLGAPAFICRVI